MRNDALIDNIVSSFRNEFELSNLMLEQNGIDKLSTTTINSILNIIEVVFKNQAEEPKDLFNILKEEAVRAA